MRGSPVALAARPARPTPATRDRSDADPSGRGRDADAGTRMRRYLTPHCDVTLYQRQSSVWSSNPPRAGGAPAHARPAAPVATRPRPAHIYARARAPWRATLQDETF